MYTGLSTIVNLLRLTQQTQNICITFVKRRPNVFDVGPTLYTCYTNRCSLLGSYDVGQVMVGDVFSVVMSVRPAGRR